MVFKDSALAHKYLDGLKGIEIGGASHNPFNLNTLNVDITDDPNTVFKQEEVKMAGYAMKVDVVAPGDNLPFLDGSLDFVVSSHVLEHFPDPIKAILEWYRVIAKGGYIFAIIPHKNRTFDHSRDRTPLTHLLNDYYMGEDKYVYGHEHVWITEDIVELINHMNLSMPFKMDIIEVQDVDDKVGNGFALLLRKVA